MLEGSFRPSSSATALPSYGIAKSGFNEQPSAVTTMRRKDMPGSSFAPVHDRHLTEYEPEEHQQSGSPPGPRYFKATQQSHSSTILNNLSPHSQSTQVAAQQSVTDGPQPAPMFKTDPRTQEAVPKNSSIGPMRAKKKPAGSACNSCHRLKTRCSGGHPCDRCAAHKVPCQFDRDLIYRSPLASNSQQASVRNAHTMSKADPGVATKSRSRGAARTNRKVSTASAAPTTAASVSGISQSPSVAPVLPISLPQVVRLSPTPNEVPSASAVHQPSPLPAITPKPGYQSTPASTPALSEAYVGYEPNLPHPNGLHLRLAALENSVSGLLQVLRAHQTTNSGLFLSASDQCPPLSPPTPPSLAMTGSSTFGPEKDHAGDRYRLGSPNSSCPIGDPLSNGLLSPAQIQYLYDVFVEFCLPNLPILHGVQIALIRARSSFLFTVMVTIGARFCSSQSVAHIPPNNSLRSTSTGGKVDLSQIMIDEQTYARLVALAHLHLSATLLKATHSLEDVRAILFLACWALVSNEDPNGTPNRWVLIGHAGRIGRSIGLDRCASELQGCNSIWNNPDIHETRREQLDAIKTDEALRAVETILSSNLRLEPSRNYFPPLHMPVERESNFSIVKLSTGSPHQYDIVSAAQIEALAELAEIWAAVNSFLSVADDRSRSLNGEQLIELGERHNQTMDTWAKKWTWQGSSWAPLLGVNLRTIRLLSESLRITLNLAFTNVLYAITGASKPTPPRLQESLAMALERVSGSSTAVIQAHRDSVREGFSLAFAPDLVTDGLVSAAITVLQLASPIGLAPVLGKPGCKETTNPPSNQNAASSHVAAIVSEDRPLTPHSGEYTGDIEANESNASTAHMVYFHHSNPQKDSTRESRNSSPSSTPSRLSKSSSPRGNFTCSFFADTKCVSNQAIGKKCFMEPPVAAHYIRMATDVLQASDRSQTRLGTIMASKIMKLAAQAGLMSPSVTTSTMGPIANTTNSFSDVAATREDRPSISSTSSLSSAKNVETSNGENSHRSQQFKTSTHRPEDTPNRLSPAGQGEDEDDDDLADNTLRKAFQGPPNKTTVNLHPLARLDDGIEGMEDSKEREKAEDDNKCRRDVRYTEENHNSMSLEKRQSDMMEEDQ